MKNTVDGSFPFKLFGTEITCWLTKMFFILYCANTNRLLIKLFFFSIFVFVFFFDLISVRSDNCAKGKQRDQEMSCVAYFVVVVVVVRDTSNQQHYQRNATNEQASERTNRDGIKSTSNLFLFAHFF